MNKKRITLVILAMLLVCVLSIAGTVAYLQDQTSVVTNTFIAAGTDGPFVDKDENGKVMFELLEYKAIEAANGSGSYTLNSEEVNGNDYEVMPGTTIPKQPFVKLSRTYSKEVTKSDAEGNVISTKTYGPAPAFLFVEVCSNNLLKGDDSVYTWAVDDSWTELADVTGPNGGDVYVYGPDAAGTVLTTVAANTRYDILAGDQIIVADDATAEEIGEYAIEMKFYAYLAQASVGNSDDPADVFAACFGND